MTQAQLSELAYQAIKARGFTNGDYTEDRDLEDVWEEGFKKALELVYDHRASLMSDATRFPLEQAQKWVKSVEFQPFQHLLSK